MPYNRPLSPPPPEILARQFERAIKSLVRRFLDHPYVFYTESDMHCYLYHRLYSGGLMNGLYPMANGRETILLHKEYPTTAHYARLTDGKLSESAQGRRRGAFDISIWDPQYIGQREHRTQKVLCAAELALNECQPGNLHTVNDAIKLAGPTNEIRYGYLLFFVRDYPNYDRLQDKVEAHLKLAAENVRVAYARVNRSDKPKSDRWGQWVEP